MSSLVPLSTSPALSALASASMDKTPRPARDSREAVKQAFDLFAGTYGQQLWCPAPNAQLAWIAALGDASPEEIAGAAFAYVRDAAADEQGRRRGSFPPKPCDLVELIAGDRKRRAAKRKEREDHERYAVECVDRIAGMKANGRWEALHSSDREKLEQWAAEGERVLAERARQAAVLSGPKPAALPGPSTAGCSAGHLATGAAVLALGFFLGRALVSMDPVRAARGAALEVARSAVGEIAGLRSDDQRLELALVSLDCDELAQEH
jgi:hypothetical protein